MVRSSSLLIICSSLLAVCAFAANEAQGTKNKEQIAEIYRPEAGKFPDVDKAHTYRGELVFVDHANRRGSVRVLGVGVFRRNDPHPFAMLPYGMIRYHGAPADLRDIPLGTILHITAFLPPDPKTSSVPVLPVNNRNIDANHYRGIGVFPAENHALLVEDEISHCQRVGLTWKLKEADFHENQGVALANLESKQDGADKVVEQKLSFDHSTRFWRGHDCLTLTEVVAEGILPASGKKSMGGRSVLLGLTWKPTPGGIFLRCHISDVWLDAAAAERSAKIQNEAHKTFMRSRWLPGWVDAVDYGKFGRATVTVTLFGGMDSSLYDDFQPGKQALLNGAENTLKITESGSAGPTQMAARGTTMEVIRQAGEAPMGSSGIQVRFETDLITEGIRPTKIVRMRPASWPDVHLPREETINGNSGNLEERFPTPAIFPKY